MSAFCLISFLSTIAPTNTFALTGGPSQPEVQAFSPIGTSDMVDVFSGDFSYNIPLLDVGGYPINMSYNAGPSMDEEASWVGLGWNIAPGMINRTMRGLPDDFKGDLVKKEFDMKDNIAFGVNGAFAAQIFAIDGGKLKNLKKLAAAAASGNGSGNNSTLDLSVGIGINYSNRNGIGFELSLSPGLSAGSASKSPFEGSLGITSSSESGFSVKPNIGIASFQKDINDKTRDLKSSLGVGLSINSRQGLTNLSLSGSTYGTKKDSKAKTGKSNYGAGAGAGMSFATSTYTPNINFPTFSTSTTGHITFGAEIFGFHGNATVSGFISTQNFVGKDRKYKGYGYLFAQNRGDSWDTQGEVYDMNRENTGAVTDQTPNLNLSNHSYDLLSVSGQGIGGSYRLFRSDIGVLSDEEIKSNGVSLAVGGELGAGNTAHGGFDASGDYTNTRSGNWKNADNETRNILKFRKTDEISPLSEPAYFKQPGELVAENDLDLFNYVGGFDAVRVKIQNVGAGKSKALRRFETGEGKEFDLNRRNPYRTKRAPRNQAITYLDANDASKFGLFKKVSEYEFNEFVFENGKYKKESENNRVRFNITDSQNLGHHLSEISVKRPDGSTYYYSNPAYNLVKKEVSFSVSEQNSACQDGLADYNLSGGNPDYKGSGPDLGNKSFDAMTVPSFAHAYLLSAVVSDDYLDQGTDGPTDDDHGEWTKINYSKAVDNFKWRTPFQRQKANYNEGLKYYKNGKSNDNTGSYVYGEKELWYVHTIETKTHVAEFHLSNRADGLGVRDEHGGEIQDTADRLNKSMKKLDRIDLYSKADKIKNGDDATPIKSVHFVYDYSLCLNVPNNVGDIDPKVVTNQGGKLTLQEVYFTYEDSKKGKLSSYKFNYATGKSNPAYDIKGYDRWGKYKESNGNNCDVHNSGLSSVEFPYVDQSSKTDQDERASAWNLTEIRLPSGGKINVDYESDDYAYVQNKDAMQMFKVTGLGKLSDVSNTNFNPVNTNRLMNIHNGSDNNDMNEVIFFKLQENISVVKNNQTNANEIVRNDYMRQVGGDLYFRFFMNIGTINSPQYEYVSGYVEPDASVGAFKNSSGDYEYGYIQVKKVGHKPKGGGFDVHPITKTAWQFARLNTPQLAYNMEASDDGGFVVALKRLAKAVTSVVEFITGVNRKMNKQDFGKELNMDKSWIRLSSPTYKKLGGGCRVAKIRISDEWQQLTAQAQGVNQNEEFEYGQEYNYETEQVVNGVTRVISSGVASYEPIIGNDENPWRKPNNYKVDRDELYQETPFGESFFPGASVGYSKVTVRNLQHNNVTTSATGKIVNEFYTSKDFPTIVKRTAIKPVNSPRVSVLGLLKISDKDFYTASQGFYIELNDMHGKPKRNTVFPENENSSPISDIQYYYKTTAPIIGRDDKSVLDNNCLVIHKNPTKQKTSNVSVPYNPGATHYDRIETAQLGVEYDVNVDFREYDTDIVAAGLQGNLDGFIAVLPIVVPIPLPAFSTAKTRFRSTSVTKIIQRNGILERTVASDLGSSVTTENLLYDAETGDVLLTKTVNEFDDEVYSFNYPAHWTYDQMGMAYKNIGATVKNGRLNNIAGASEIFSPGDQVGIVYTNDVVERVWVAGTTNNSVTLIQDNDTPVASNRAFKVLKVVVSGRKNQQSTSVGSVVSLVNPMVDVDGNGDFDELFFDEILGASATEFTDEWKTYCDCTDGISYVSGIRGHWRPKRAYTFLTERVRSVENNNSNIRKDGVFKLFNPYWIPSGTDVATYWEDDDDKDDYWTWATEVVNFSPYGYELESRDRLLRYSAALYGYNNVLPTAVANNSRLKEIANDNFEDYDYGGCNNDHFNYKTSVNSSNAASVTNDESHSGRRSLQLDANSEVSTKKFLIDCEEVAK